MRYTGGFISTPEPTPDQPIDPCLRRSRDTMTAILEATDAIVRVTGSARISIVDVCRAARISRGTFYNYYHDQAALLKGLDIYERQLFQSSSKAHLDHIIDRLDPPYAITDLLSSIVQDPQPHSARARELLAQAPEFALPLLDQLHQDLVESFESSLAPVIAHQAVQSPVSDQDVHRLTEIVASLFLSTVLTEL